MKRMSFRLSQALDNGRSGKGVPDSREVVLERLLRKRAAAFQAGLADQEQLLRSQIIWSLPMTRPAGESVAASGGARAAALRDQARHYRDLIAGTTDERTATSLAMMAGECDAEAERIDGACTWDKVLHGP